jgi:phosphatidylserine/phosphatidylglycerophosphate/cardiolipin synthase-like enzyme
MRLLGALESIVARQFDRGVGPVSRHFNRRRHSSALEHGATGERPKDAWWSDQDVWFSDGTPPRRNNRLTPLIDGEAYLATLVEEINRAEHYILIAGWCLTPHVPLRRDDPETVDRSHVLAVLLAAAHKVPVRLLLWGGAPFLIQPTARAVHAVQRSIETEARRDGVDLLCRLDETAHPSHCHHQKTVVVDGRVAFVGGMDITTFQGDRWDRPGHPLRSGLNWHDVQMRIEGEIVADVEANFRQRWAETASEPLPSAREPVLDNEMQTPAQIVRTIPRGIYQSEPNGEFGIHHALIAMIKNARSLIYLENQYLWSPDVVDALKDAINGPHGGRLRIVIVLPARAYSGKWDNDRRVAALRKADDGRGIFEAYSLYAAGPHLGVTGFYYRPIYVHAKVTVVDDEWLSIGSANLNTRGLITDSELNVVAHDPGLARRLRVALWAEHLGMPEQEIAAAEPRTLIDDVWRSRAAENAATITRADGLLNGNVHRYELGRMPGRIVLEEMESLTFEH